MVPLAIAVKLLPQLAWISWLGVVHKPNGHWFSSQSEHMPGLQGSSSAGARTEGANLCFSLTSMFLSLIFSLASPLSKTERNLKNSTQAFDYFAIIFYHMFSHLILNRISSLLCM